MFAEWLFPPLSLEKEALPEFSPYRIGRKLQKNNNNPAGRAICQTSSFVGKKKKPSLKIAPSFQNAQNSEQIPDPSGGRDCISDTAARILIRSTTESVTEANVHSQSSESGLVLIYLVEKCLPLERKVREVAQCQCAVLH